MITISDCFLHTNSATIEVHFSDGKVKTYPKIIPSILKDGYANEIRAWLETNTPRPEFTEEELAKQADVAKYIKMAKDEQNQSLAERAKELATQDGKTSILEDIENSIG